ncbi:MAG: 3'-5' exonuclease [Helicobacteraceae bacterium]|nr:3'-5' exonuclease [Helicobacteraceae bacterium]
MFKSWFKQRNRKKLKDESYSFLFDEYEGDEVVVFDCETTGLDTKKDEILSIGAVIVKDNKILTSQSFEIFTNPKKKINEVSITIHHIRECDVESDLSVEQGVDKFLKFIGNRPLVGYYLEFDVAMVNSVIKPWLGIKLPNEQLEVSGIYYDYKTKFIPQGNIDLHFDTIIDDLNLVQLAKHDALNDAIMTAMIYIKLKQLTK